MAACQPSAKTAPAENSASAQCRFCLEEAYEGDLLSPCKCQGTSRFVHAACLRRWQREVGTDLRSTICQVCRATFALTPPWAQLPDTDSEHAGAPGARLLVADDRDPFLGDGDAVFGSSEPSSPIFNMVRTNPRYDREPSIEFPAEFREHVARCIAPGCLVVRTPAESLPASPEHSSTSDDMLALVEAMLSARAAHWRRSVFLIGGVWHGQAGDGSDALLGINLAGAPAPIPAFPKLQELRAQLGGEAPLSAVIGGPKKPSRPLALVYLRGSPPRSTPELVHVILPVPTFEADLRGAPRGPATPQRPAARSSYALFGEPHHVSDFLASEPLLRPAGGRLFLGHSTWSSQQLMCEVAQGRWGLCAAGATDLAAAIGLAAAARDGTGDALWASMWSTRALLGPSEVQAGLHAAGLEGSCTAACVVS